MNRNFIKGKINEEMKSINFSLRGIDFNYKEFIEKKSEEDLLKAFEEYHEYLNNYEYPNGVASRLLDEFNDIYKTGITLEELMLNGVYYELAVRYYNSKNEKNPLTMYAYKNDKDEIIEKENSEENPQWTATEILFFSFVNIICPFIFIYMFLALFLSFFIKS